MMKRLYIILCIIFCFGFSFSQTTPAVVPRSSDVIVASDGGLFARNTLRPPVFLDTALANASLFLLDSCGRQIFTYSDNSYWLRACSPKRWIKILKTGDALIGANNGLSLSGSTVQLGGTLIQNTNINLGGDSLNLSGTGYLRARISAPSAAALIVENTAPGFKDVAYFIGENAPVRLFATSASGFAGFTYYTGGVLRWATGYDGSFPHAYIVDLKNGTPSATFEVEGVTKGGFSYATGNFFMGSPPTPDTAVLNLYRIGSGLTSASQQIHLNVSNYNSTYNTTSGAITNRMAIIDNSATRSLGGNNLTNTALFLRARNAQFNNALYVDSGRSIFHNDFSATAQVCVDDLYSVNNATSTQQRQQMHISKTVRYSDTAAGSETFATAVSAQALYQAKGSVTIPDHLSGSALEAGFFPRRNSAYTGAVLFQGATTPSNTVTTMPSALVSRFDMTAAQAGANSIRMQGYWAGFTSWIGMNTGNSVGRFAWINTGAAQETGGTIDTGYAVYINALPVLVTQKYSIMQVGASDTNYYAGITRHVNLTQKSDTTTYKPMAVSANGVVVKMDGWHGSGGGGATALIFEGNHLPEIKWKIPAIAIAATGTTLTNHPYANADGALYYFTKTNQYSSGVKYGSGPLWSNSLGDSVRYLLPYGIGVGSSFTESHPWSHSRVHPNATATFDPSVRNIPGQFLYFLEQRIKYPIYNMGIGGQTTEQMRSRWPRDVKGWTIFGTDGRGNNTMPRRKPVFVVFDGAGNDPYAAGMSPTRTIENIEFMARSCREQGIIFIVMNSPMGPQSATLGAGYLDSVNRYFEDGRFAATGGVYFNLKDSVWSNRNYGYDGVNGDSVLLDSADHVHFNRSKGNDTLAARLVRLSKLPVLTKIAVINKLDPSNPIDNYNYPDSFSLGNIPFKMTKQSDTIAVTQAFTYDTAWFTPKHTINVRGNTTVYGPGLIEFMLDNNPNNENWIRKSKWGDVAVLPNALRGSELILRQEQNNDSLTFGIMGGTPYSAGVSQWGLRFTTSGFGGYITVNSAGTTTRLYSADYTAFGAMGYAASGNVRFDGGNNILGDLQIMRNGIGSTLGSAISVGNTGSAFNFQSVPTTGMPQYQFKFYTGNSVGLGAVSSRVTSIFDVDMGFGNAGNFSQRGYGYNWHPTFNQTASQTDVQLTWLRYDPTPTSLVNTKHRFINVLRGDSYFQTVADNFGIGVDSNTTLAAKLHVNGTVRLDGMLVGASTSPLLVKDADSIIRQIPQSSLTGVSNIYNNDGTIAANRTVTGATRTLTYTGMSAFNMFSTNFTFAKTDGTFKYTGGVIAIADNSWEFGYLKAGSLSPAIIVDTNNNVTTGASLATGLPLYATGGSFYAAQGIQSGAGNFYKVRNATTTGSVALTDYFITIDATGGNVTLTLPAASTAFGANVGIIYAFKRLDASGNTITISRTSSDLIDGATTFTLGAQYDGKKIICSSASAWSIIP